MTWRTTPWTRCMRRLLVLVIVSGVSVSLIGNLNVQPFEVAFVAPLVATFLMGMHVQAWWWVYGPVMVATVLGGALMLMILLMVVGTDDGLTRQFGLAMLLAIAASLALGSIAYAVVAGAGVLLGRHRKPVPA